MNYNEKNYYKRKDYEFRQYLPNERDYRQDMTHQYQRREDTSIPETYDSYHQNESKYLRDSEKYANNYNKRSERDNIHEENMHTFSSSKRARYSDHYENSRNTRSSLSSTPVVIEEEYSNNRNYRTEQYHDSSHHYANTWKMETNYSGINHERDDYERYEKNYPKHISDKYVTEDIIPINYNTEKGECSTNKEFYPHDNYNTSYRTEDVGVGHSGFNLERPPSCKSHISEPEYSIQYNRIEENIIIDMVVLSEYSWDLTPENADLVIDKISDLFEDWIVKTSDASITFQGHPTYVPDKFYILIQCSNERSADWLIKTVNDMEPLWEGGKLYVNRLIELPLLVKCGLFLPKYNRDIKTLMKALVILNPTYKINEWNVQKHEHKNEGLLLCLGVPQHTLMEKVLPNNCKVYYRLGSVRLQFFSPEGALVSEYIPENRPDQVFALNSNASEKDLQRASHTEVPNINSQECFLNEPISVYQDSTIKTVDQTHRNQNMTDKPNYYKSKSPKQIQSVSESFSSNYVPVITVRSDKMKPTAREIEVHDWEHRKKSFRIPETVVSDRIYDNFCPPPNEENLQRDPQERWRQNISKQLELNDEFNRKHDTAKTITDYSKNEKSCSYRESKPDRKTDKYPSHKQPSNSALTPPSTRQPFSIPELNYLFRETRRLFNRAKNTRVDSDWDIYKISQANYRKALRRHGIKNETARKYEKEMTK